MRKHIDYNDLVEDYEKRFGKKNYGRKVKVLHQEEIDKLHVHPSDEELRRRKKLAKPEICIYKIKNSSLNFDKDSKNMGMFDMFRIEHDYHFWNNKGELIIIPKNEYQTKSYENMLSSFYIVDNHIEKYKCHYVEHKEYPKLDPKRWELIEDGYEKINYTGEFVIYDDDFSNCFIIYTENGNILNIKKLKNKN